MPVWLAQLLVSSTYIWYLLFFLSFLLLFLQDNKFGYFGITLNHQPDTRQYVLIRYCWLLCWNKSSSRNNRNTEEYVQLTGNGTKRENAYVWLEVYLLSRAAALFLTALLDCWTLGCSESGFWRSMRNPWYDKSTRVTGCSKQLISY